MRKIWAGLILLAVIFSLILVAVLAQDGPDYYGSGRDRIAVIRIEGAIIGGSGGSLFEGGMTWSETVAAQIKSAAEDPTVDAVIFRINSPGGTVAAGQEIANAIDNLRASGKITVASMGDTGASAAYWIASRCDSIVASPTTVTGSIGVIINTTNFAGLYEMLGIENEVIKSGQLKDMGSPNRPLTGTERELFQEMVDDMFSQFVDAVQEGRNLSRDEVLSIADGRVFTGRQAYTLGLVDRLGFFEEAVEEATEMAGLSNPEVFEMAGPTGVFRQLFGGMSLNLVPPGGWMMIMPSFSQR
ncbi:MAG: signal peptide peptidase SppA [Eubacteriales bacterium]|nr:signal peptide peptidase SppA [Bacillota bacterium]MBV1727529.1 signal peptide peptidase SppA [Desulforudis sp.]MDQ7790011.1 signal peptide peptidase SppA [Clostridia bacterium]MDZ4043917.1 signal peptide peptidase SppA [Eubacteriales bacterium]MBU4534167.1 signal peptide peptidase SppA [Bacillota bacterium]